MARSQNNGEIGLIETKAQIILHYEESHLNVLQGFIMEIIL